MAEKLAIKGGNPALPPSVERYSLNFPILSEDDIQATDVLRSGRLTGSPGSPQITALAREWAEYVGAK